MSHLMVFEHLILRRILNRRDRHMYIRDIFKNRVVHGQLFLLQELESDPEYHQKYLRMDKRNFEAILGRIKHRITKKSTHKYPIGPKLRLALTLRYLATGASMTDLSFSFRISPSSVSKIIPDVLAAIWDEFQPEYLPEPNIDMWNKNADDFSNKWNFPHVLGCLDGKHVRVRNFRQGGSDYFNYKHFFSIVLLASADAGYKFNWISVGASGSESDGGILERSRFGNDLLEENLELPAPSEIAPNMLLPYVFLGDQGFPLKKNLMRPFTFNNKMTQAQKVFNYRLSRARRVVENSFGILVARWRIFKTEIDANRDLVIMIVKATVILHNFIMKNNDTCLNLSADRENADGEQVEGSWRSETRHDTGLTNIARQGSNNSSNAAQATREKFANYFCSDLGAIPWQWEHVRTGLYA